MPLFGGSRWAWGHRHQVHEHGHAKKPDDRRHQMDPPEQGLQVKSIAGVAADHRDADQRYRHAEAAADAALDQAAFGKGRDQSEPEDGEPEVFDGTEGEGEFGKRRREGEERQGADETAGNGGQARQRDGEIAVAPLGHGEAVEGGGDVLGRARRVEEDRGVGAAVGGTGIDGAEEYERRDRRHGEGHRQHHRHRESRRQAGQGPEDGPDDDAEDGEHQVEGRDGVGGVGQNLHGATILILRA